MVSLSSLASESVVLRMHVKITTKPLSEVWVRAMAFDRDQEDDQESHSNNYTQLGHKLQHYK